MELDRTRITGTPFSRLCAWEGVEQEGAQVVPFWSPKYGYFRHWAGTGDGSGAAGRYRTKRRGRGHAKFVSLNSRRQNTTLWRRR